MGVIQIETYATYHQEMCATRHQGEGSLQCRFTFIALVNFWQFDENEIFDYPELSINLVTGIMKIRFEFKISSPSNL